MTLTGIEKLSRARVQMYSKSPFFAYLALNLDFREFTKEEKKVMGERCTMAVDGFGNLYWNEDFVNDLKESELIGVVAHECMHVALQHLDRENKRFLNVTLGSLRFLDVASSSVTSRNFKKSNVTLRNLKQL